MNYASTTSAVVLASGSEWDWAADWANVEKLHRLSLLAMRLFCDTYDLKFEYGKRTRKEVDFRADMSALWEKRHAEAHAAYFAQCRAEGMAYHVIERAWSGDIIRDYLDYVE